MVSYIAVIDGGAALGRAAGFDVPVCSVGVRPAGFAGCVVVSPVRLPAGPIVLWGGFGPASRCLTCSSEEEETWTTASLRPGFGRALRFRARRRNCSDGHVSRFTALRPGFGLVGAGVFGTRRDARAFVLRAMIVTSREQVLSFNLRV